LRLVDVALLLRVTGGVAVVAAADADEILAANEQFGVVHGRERRGRNGSLGDFVQLATARAMVRTSRGWRMAGTLAGWNRTRQNDRCAVHRPPR